MHIVWLMNGDEPYGIATAATNLALELKRHGCQVTILTMHDGEFFRKCESVGLVVENLRLGKAPSFIGHPVIAIPSFVRWIWFALKNHSVLRRKLLKIGADVLHFQWPNHILVAAIASKQAAIKCIWEMPNVISNRFPLGLNRRIYQWCCKRYSITPLANSEYTGGSLLPGPVKPVIAYLGVDPNRYNPTNVHGISRQQLNISEDTILFGICGRICSPKGQYIFGRSLLDCVRDGHDIQLLLIGGPIDSDYTKDIENLFKSAGQRHRLHLVGKVEKPEEYYSVCDVVVSSSTVAEGFGLSIVEAMMSGRPVLAHSLGGPGETIVDGNTGWLVHQATREAFACGIKRVVDARKDLKRLGEQARMHAITQFSLTSQAVRYLTILHPYK